jgi:hypothetical protein
VINRVLQSSMMVMNFISYFLLHITVACMKRNGLEALNFN